MERLIRINEDSPVDMIQMELTKAGDLWIREKTQDVLILKYQLPAFLTAITELIKSNEDGE